MNLTLHLIGKDFLHLRLYLSVWWGLVILQAIFIGSYPQDFLGDWRWEVSPSHLLRLFAVLEFCLLTVILSQLVQKDSTVGSTAFWLGRPLSGKRLVASKLLFLLFIVVLPALVVQVLLLLVRGVTLEDTLLSFPQMVFPQLFHIGVAMVLASLTSSLPRLILLGVIALVALPLLWFMSSSLFVAVFATASSPIGDAPVARPIPPSSFDTQLMGIFLVLLATSGIVVGHQYLTRRTMLSRILLFSGILLSLLSMGSWSKYIWAIGPQLSSGVLDPTQLTARIEEENLVFDPRGDKTMLLRGDIVLGNLPSDIVALPEQVSANLALPSGESLVRHVGHKRIELRSKRPILFSEQLAHRQQFFQFNREKAESLRKSLGDVSFLNIYTGHLFGHQLPDLIAISEDLYQRYRSVRTVYSARIDYLVQRHTITTMRLEKGSRHIRGSDQVQVLSIERTPRGGGLTILLSESTHRLAGNHWQDVHYLLFNPSRREVIVGFSSYASNSAYVYSPPLHSPLTTLRVGRWELNFYPPSNGPPIDPVWFDGAELIRVESRDLGWFSKSIRVEDFVMERVPLSDVSSRSREPRAAAAASSAD